MQHTHSMLITETKTPSIVANSSFDFAIKELYWTSDTYKDVDIYQQIAAKVLEKPKQLLSHIQRIYFTSDCDSSEQLYAALVDLLCILDGKGRALSQRMISATQSQLTSQQFATLCNAIKKQDISLLSENKYSLLTKGLVGTDRQLIEQSIESTVHDPLIIARDYIEFSQLDAAIETLENSILKSPNREELQTELLQLYKVTNNSDSFTTTHLLLKKKEMTLSHEWQNLAEYFSQKNEAR